MISGNIFPLTSYIIMTEQQQQKQRAIDLLESRYSMEEILKLLKTLPKEYLQVIILELMKDQKISYEEITQAYVEYLDMLRKGTSEKFLMLQSKVMLMYTGNVKDRNDKLKDAMHWLLDNGFINTTHEDIDKHK